jgi:DnaA family protein
MTRAKPPTGSAQLPLALQLQPPAVFDTFVTGRNGALLAHLKAAANGRRHELIWLAGAAGTGKTHLLQAACRAADDSAKRVMYLNLAAAPAASPALLDSLGQMDFLALDGLDAGLGHAAWERALFSVLNDFQLGDGVLLLAARQSPAAAGFQLPDLRSRAAGAVLYRVQALEEPAVLEALLLHARFRGLKFDTAAAQFLLSHVRRDMAALCTYLDRLDRASLIEKRKVTIPFIREILQEAFVE